MIAATATATEMQNNFGRYLNLVMSGQEVIVTKNGREVGRFIPKDAAVSIEKPGPIFTFPLIGGEIGKADGKVWYC